MQRPSLLLAAIAFLAPTATAHAQDMTVRVNSLEGRTNVELADLATTMAAPITQAECAANATIELQFNNVDMSRSNLYFFNGATCNMVMPRSDSTDTSCTELVGPISTMNRQEVVVDLQVGQLIPCDGTSGVLTIWALAVDNPAADTVDQPGQAVTFPIAFDLVGPAAASGFMATGGESSISLEWEGDTDLVDTWQVFVDPNGCVDGEVMSTLADNPEAFGPVATIAGTGGTGTVPFPESVPIPGEAAVAIRAVDRSSNIGELSEVVCVSRFEVTSWLEMYCADGSADACGDGGCAVSPGTGSSAPLIGLGLVVGIALMRRRRR